MCVCVCVRVCVCVVKEARKNPSVISGEDFDKCGSTNVYKLASFDDLITSGGW